MAQTISATHSLCPVSAAEDKLGWHAKPLPKDMAEVVMKDLQSRIINSSKHLYPPAPVEDSPPVSLRNIRMPSAPSYKPGEKVFTNTQPRAQASFISSSSSVRQRRFLLVSAADCNTESLRGGFGQAGSLQRASCRPGWRHQQPHLLRDLQE